MSRWVWEVGDIFIIRRLRQCRYPPGQPRERDATLRIDHTGERVSGDGSKKNIYHVDVLI